MAALGINSGWLFDRYGQPPGTTEEQAPRICLKEFKVLSPRATPCWLLSWLKNSYF